MSYLKGYSAASGRTLIPQLLWLGRYKFQNQDRLADLKFKSFVRIRDALEKHLGRPLTGRTLLEIGCGQWLANLKIFASMGNTVIGIDPELPPQSMPEYQGFIRKCGFQRGLKTLLNEKLFRRSFDKRLEQLSGLGLTSGYRLLRVSGNQVPIPDESVDAVFSDNVFEHIADVPGVMAEVRRVLRPGGIAVIVVHPYAAFSGGHHLSTISHQGKGSKVSKVPPWDHLHENHFPSGIYLNRLRETEYRAIFEVILSTVAWDRLGPEGEEYLTPEIERELSDRGYNREELLTGKLLYTGRKE